MIDEEERSEDVPLDARPEPLPPVPKGRSARCVRLDVGARLEAQDLYKNWYPAKVVDVDDEEKEVLIHFDGWNQRHDEWIGFDSPRLRAVTVQEKQESRTFQIRPNVRVEARWKTIGYFSGTVVAMNDDDSCQVLFDDGIEMKVMKCHIRMPKSKAVTPPDTSVCTEKAKRQERQTLLAEARRQRAIRRNSDGQPKSEPPSPRSPETKAKQHDGKCESESLLPVKHNLVAEMPLPSFRTELNTPADVDLNTPTPPTTQSDDVVSKPEPAQDQLSMSVPSMVPMMNEKQVKQETMPCSPVQDPIAIATRQPETVTPVVQPIVTTPTRPVHKPLIKRSTRTEPFVTRSKTKAADSRADKPSSRSFAPKEWVVVMDHNKYKCNVRGCDKAFRKASLLNYHVKYYHSAEQLESPCKKHKAHSEQSTSGLGLISRLREPSLSETNVLPQPEVSGNDTQATPQSTDKQTAARQKSTSSLSPVKEKKGSERPLFVLGARHPHEPLQPIHIQERRKFKKCYDWYWTGDMGDVDKAGDSSGDVVRQLRSLLTVCHNDLAADLTAVDEMLRSVDMQISALKKLKNLQQKSTQKWKRRDELVDRRAGGTPTANDNTEDAETVAHCEEKPMDEVCENRLTRSTSDEQASTSESRWTKSELKRERDNEVDAADEKIDEEKLKNGSRVERMEDVMFLPETCNEDGTFAANSESSDGMMSMGHDRVFGLFMDGGSVDKQTAERDREEKQHAKSVSLDEVMTSHHDVKMTSLSLDSQGKKADDQMDEDRLHSLALKIHADDMDQATSDGLKSPGSSGSSTLPDMSENMEVSDNLLDGNADGCHVEGDEDMEGNDQDETRLLHWIEQLQDELEERMTFLESQLAVLDGNDAKTLEQLRKMADNIETTLETETLDVVKV